jgi:hypothetical protein
MPINMNSEVKIRSQSHAPSNFAAIDQTKSEFKANSASNYDAGNATGFKFSTIAYHGITAFDRG